MNSEAVLDPAVVVCVAEALFQHIVPVAVKGRRSRSCPLRRQRWSRSHFNRHLTAVVRRCGIVHGHLIEHSTV